MSALLQPPPHIRWLRRQRRLAWQAILACALIRIGGAALMPDAAPAEAATQPRAEQLCASQGDAPQPIATGNPQ
ncbi:hypothetical protein ACG3SL_05390 [Sphingomonas sp. CJ20]